MERVMIEIAGFIKDNSDYQVTIIKLARSDKNFYKVPKGVTLVEPNFYFDRRLRVYHSLKLLWFLVKTIRRIKPISVLSFGEMYNSFVLLSSFFTNAKYFVSDRSQPNRHWSFFHIKMRKLIYGRAYGIVAQTRYSKSFFEKVLNHKNIKVIANPGRDHDFILEQKEKEKAVLYVGRLIKSKRLDILIDVFDKINNPEWELWIVGDGSEREKLEIKIKTLNTKNNIMFFGEQKNVGKFYSKAQIFAFTSISEGFPNVLIEALSYGIPLVSFDCVAGPSDIIDEGWNGFLIPFLNTTIFEDKLNILMSDVIKLEKMSLNAIESSKKYKSDVISSQFLKFIIS